MLHDLPVFISVIFILTTIATLLFFYWTLKNSRADTVRKRANIILVVLIIWLIIQAVLANNNVYNSDTTSVPPKLMLLGVAPMILTIIFLFLTKKGRLFIDSLPLKNITWLNIIRIPVELVLLELAIHKAVPQLMTFEGRNFDILSGITAPFVAYFGFTKNVLSRKVILTWNFICLALLANIVVNAILAAPFFFQKFAFDQPNIAILYFPFIWLPAFIVPVVLFGHLVSIRQLIRSQALNNK
jgi:hypothetical protein